MLGLHGQSLGTTEGIRVGQRLGIGSYLRPTAADILGALYHGDWAASDPNISLSSGRAASIPSRGSDAGAMAQGTGAKQPAWNATSFNGGPGITFNGTSHELRCVLSSPIAISARYYFWCVFKRVGTTGYVVQVSNTAQAATASNLRIATSAPVSAIVSADGVDSITGAAVDTNPHIGAWGPLSVTTNRLAIDGVSVAAAFTGANSVAVNEICIGAAFGTLYSNIVFARLILCGPGEPSAAQQAAMLWFLRTQCYGVP